MTAELPGLLPFRWEANDGPITPRRPEDDVEFGAAGAVAAGTRAGERVARSGRGHPYVSSNCVVTVVSAGIFMGLGVWMWGWPASFSAYVNFPIHVHFLHDMGVYHIGLAIGMLVALFRRDAIYAVLVGLTVICVLHAINHVIDLDIGGNPSDPCLIAGQAVISGVGAWLRGRQLAAQARPAATAD